MVYGQSTTSNTARIYRRVVTVYVELVRNIPPTLHYENQLTVAHGDFVMLHGRFSGLGERVPNWIVVDIVRVENGVLAEHWDVIQDEATQTQSRSGKPMFGATFPG
jgi:predicted SnoaL-like aldol condensation-catalyzing enzyme